MTRVTTYPKADVLRKENHFISSEKTQVLDWSKARTNCLDRGMDLASGSLDLLQQILTGETRGGTGRFWVGLSKSGFIWDRNTKPMTHLQFRCGEPNNYRGVDEYCVELWPDGEYNDNLCATFKPFVCEWDREPGALSTTKPPFFTRKLTKPEDHPWMYAGIVGWVLVTILLLAFSIHMYKTNLELLKQNKDDFKMTGSSGAISTIELDNPDDPTLGNNNSNTNAEQVAFLFAHLRRGTNRRYYYFRAALLTAGYYYVVRNFALPAQTPNPGETQDVGEDQPSSSSATGQPTCPADTPTSSAWSRFVRFLRHHLLRNPSSSHRTTIENSAFIDEKVSNYNAVKPTNVTLVNVA